MKTLRRISALLLALLCLTGCGGGPRSLTGQSGKPAPVESGMEEGDVAALAGFSLELLKETWAGKNALVSPLSALSALGMTAGGAKGETLEQMEAVLGLPVERLNAALAAWAGDLPKKKNCRVDLANSVWIRDDGSFEADPDFLESAANWYRAEVYASKFDAAAVRDINGWVDKHTHGMIPEILSDLQDSTMMVLVNALALEAEWEETYRTNQVWDNQTFTSSDGAEQPVTLMYSSEGRYLKDEGAQGFLKFYKGGRWAFAALLPDEGVTLEEYLTSLTGERLYALLSGAEEQEVYAAIPKFKSAYGVELNDALKALGMTDAFDMNRADLSGLGRSQLGPLFISQVLHRTYIEVDEKGTKAGAATAVMADAGADAPRTVPTVHLDRPFLYMLVDTETNLPAFIGAVTTME